ncbi:MULTISPECIES: hypothetical protein [unclassified Pseudomonas]|uniref:hypothetical protein n=1 Tax=unclassified Pseudomonas TaxID=196821 RepID=UPI0021CA62A5|nr:MULTISPECIES: hypothetical protein [unclassified Pseudomonas]MCU1732842.1 hypothetical protein [Pseudomonas sp. 20P_3.2_Bac4]MCU1745149.1 hypothetical protein [Pseudomonas sp. 20P_3.2_Bac5]
MDVFFMLILLSVEVSVMCLPVLRRFGFWHCAAINALPANYDGEFIIEIVGKPVPTGAALCRAMFSKWQCSLDEQGGWLH